MYTLNWKQLEYFITLAEIQNYTKAASVLNITQPALSRAINNLEQSIGIPLFEKSGTKNFYFRKTLFAERFSRRMKCVWQSRVKGAGASLWVFEGKTLKVLESTHFAITQPPGSAHTRPRF